MAKANQTKLAAKLQMYVILAVLTAIVIVLQSFAGAIPFGPFTITLSLVPIILGAILYGPFAGAFLGAVFGAVVCVSVVSGTDPGGHLMFQQLPALTLFLCILKSTLAGFIAGFVCRYLSKKNLYVGAVTAAVICPIVNTGILACGMLAFYSDLVTGWALDAGYSNAFLYIVLGMVGINFLVETAINLVLVPVIVTVIRLFNKNNID